MHILLFGKNGQVGWELQRALAPLGRITAVDFDSTDYCGDFSNPAGVAETVRLLKPNVIVNAAAHTAVDKAESDVDMARTVNATAPGVLAREAAAIGATSAEAISVIRERRLRKDACVMGSELCELFAMSTLLRTILKSERKAGLSGGLSQTRQSG